MSSTTKPQSNPGAFIIYFGMLAILGAFLAFGVYAKPAATPATTLSQAHY